MVISFSKDPAFQQLHNNGAVVTLREGERASTPTGGVQETWCNRGRTLPKDFDVRVRHLGQFRVSPRTLGGYAAMSGFGSVQDWLQAIYDTAGPTVNYGHLYLVTRRDDQ